MTGLSIEHILLFILVFFLLYQLLGNYGCGDSFRVGGLLSRPPIEYPEDWNKSCVLDEVQKQSCNFNNSPYTGRSICNGENNYIDCIKSTNPTHHFKWCKNINKCSDAFNKEFLEKMCDNVSNESKCEICAGKNQELREYCKESEIQNICKKLF